MGDSDDHACGVIEVAVGAVGIGAEGVGSVDEAGSVVDVAVAVAVAAAGLAIGSIGVDGAGNVVGTAFAGGVIVIVA